MKKNISIIIPTLNEKENINKLFYEIKKNLDNQNIIWEVIFVDDSEDNQTANAINKLQNIENNICLIKRFENRGWSSALIQGALSANAEYVIFIDGDLQHPPNKIKNLYDEIRNKNLDIVSASRFLRSSPSITSSWRIF